MFQKKIEYIRFWNKILDQNKTFSSVLDNFGPKAFVLVGWKKIFGTNKSFALSLKTLAQFETFWICFDIIF